MQPDIQTMHDAIESLRRKSVSSNGDGNASCTVNDLQKLRDSIADALEVIVDNLQ